MTIPAGSGSSVSGFYASTDTLRGVHYGPGSVDTALPKLLNALGMKKVLIVTGKTLYTKTGVVRKIEDILKDHNAHSSTFYGIGQHSPINEIRNAVTIFKQNHCDGIVSVGGGSPIDSSKAIRYHLQQETGGIIFPQIAIPTTLSAAEFTIGAGYTDDQGNKVAISSQSLAPAGVILDAQLTVETPQRLWLSSGIRALDHAVENLYRPLVPAPIKNLCYAAIADLFAYLPRSKANPHDIYVREKLQLASWMSLWPLRTEQYSPLGLSHGLGHKLGASYQIPHGITSCLTLAPTVALKAAIATPEDKEHLAKSLFYLQQPSTGTLVGDVLKLSSLIHALVVDLELNSTLSEYKVPAEDLPNIVKRVVGDDTIYEQVLEMLRRLL